MSETESLTKRTRKKRSRALLWGVVAAVLLYLIIRNFSAFSNILLVALGFGAVVLVHEFGHFILAKFSDVKVEAFSIGFPPALLGIQRMENGYRIRLFPRFSEKEGEPEPERPSFTIGKKGTKASETEYRIGVIPIGGFVKMLGQEDSGPVKTSDDPRSYANKPATSRIAILSAGVICNVISAVLIFMIVFMIGINLPPAVVGGVIPNSPAALAGLKAGDEVIEVDGKSENLDFSNIQIAAALSDVNEPVPMKVRHEDGSEEELSIVAKLLEGNPMRLFGVVPARSLTIDKVTDVKKLHEKTGLLPGDRIKSVNGKEVRHSWELAEVIGNALAPEVTLSAERKGTDGRTESIETRIGLKLMSMGTGHIYSMVPRLRMEQVHKKKSFWDRTSAKLRRIPEKIGILKELTAKPFLQSGDIILSIGKVHTPTYSEFRDVVTQYEDKELPIEVLRKDVNGFAQPCTINVVPKRHADVNEVMIGISFLRLFDTEHAVVAKTIALEDGPPKLDIPEGAKITAVDGTPVSNFYDVVREIRRYPGERITLDWWLNDEIAGDVSLEVSEGDEYITFKPALGESVPFEDLKRPYKAGNPIEAIGMGYKKTLMFITQTYLTLRRLVSRDVSPKSLMGPVGILAASYTIVSERPFVYYAYFLGLISACIAVVNFLPLPPLDGGLVVLLLVEKIKGSALSERTQGVIAYAGWVLIAGFFLYVTFNDVVRTFFG
ncbi:MAG: site-2 protease family protein [Planctomycetota bacterium]|jgi:regulator of sigma E protease